MAFKMKGPGLPGFRKTQKHAFYKSKPFEGDGRPSSSPFQHNEHPHAGTSMHALQSQREAKLAEDDYSVKRDVELDDDATTEEKLTAEQSTDLVQEKTRYTEGQIYHARNMDIRNHKKGFRRMMMFGDNPGVKDGKVVNTRKFNNFMESAWAKEQQENNMQFAYRDLSGTKTVKTHLDPTMTEQKYQLTNQEAVDYHLGNRISASVQEIFTKPRDQWTKEEKLAIDRLTQEKDEATRDLIKTNLKERLTRDWHDQHATRGGDPTEEQAAAEGWRNIGEDNQGNIIWKNNRGERWVPENAWSSTEWLGKVGAGELGLGVEDEDFWNVGELRKTGKTVEEHIPEGVVGEQYVSGGVDPNTGKTLQDSRGNVGTAGVTHVYPSGGRNQAYYNYRDESGEMHKKISQQELDKLKLEQPSYIAEQEKKQQDMANAANAKEQALKQERINLAEDHMSTQPDPDDYDMSNKRDRKKFERKSKKWTEEAENLFGSQWRDYFTE